MAGAKPHKNTKGSLQGFLFLLFAGLFIGVSLSANAQTTNQDSLSWYQCKLAGDVQSVSMHDGQTSITLYVRISVFQHGFRAVKTCPFKRGDTITLTNFVDAQEAADLKAQGRTLDRGFITGNMKLENIEPDDHLTLLYGYYFEHGIEREVWNFLRVKRN